MPEFYTLFAPKNYKNAQTFPIFAGRIDKIPEFYETFARKMPKFYMKSIFSGIFLGAPVSYAYVHSSPKTFCKCHSLLTNRNVKELNASKLERKEKSHIGIICKVRRDYSTQLRQRLA